TNSMMTDDRFLLGIDMLKPKDILERAYNDSTGITSKFNKNILNILNRELNANFNLDHFNHRAIFNTEKERIEMYLQANRDVSAKISALGLTVELKEGETIHTEICRKFSEDSVEQMAFNAGLSVTKWFSDSKGWFSLVEMAPQNS
ncbi:MAG TPA: L-histidine N(alpha)-methyltransferase, partial [Candidatus Marinimicrobia bacterium]|nr:L-histidine N(alpha)-methyltransferase [Candidatus Neomarinimicrobiota bacterium]